MANVIAWFMFVLGIAHIIFGLIKFKAPIAGALSDGFVGKFLVPEARRTAFWFLIFGPMLMLAGHVAVHAVAIGDIGLLKILGVYSFFTSLIGVTAFPRSPFWGALIASLLLIAASFRYIT
jgi:Family of unknown function (DUF6463)